MFDKPTSFSTAALQRVDQGGTGRSRKPKRRESLQQYALRRVLDEWDERSERRGWRFRFYVGADSTAAVNGQS